MKPTQSLTLPLALLLTSACTEQTLPVFGDPVPMTVPSTGPAYGPRLTQRTSDSAILSWMEMTEQADYLKFSAFGIDAWEPSGLASTSTGMFVNWADLPAVSTTSDGKLFAHWLSHSGDDRYSYEILTSFSDDNGHTWSEPKPPHSDDTPTEHGFVSTYDAEGGVGLIWLDGRETPDGGMTLRSATVSADGNITAEALLDPFVCDCCQTDTTMTSSGPVTVYRNRTDNETRDIYVARNIDGIWQDGFAIADDNWNISGCPVNGPSIAADGDQVVVAWFTAANNQPKVRAAISTNAGRTFSPPTEFSVRKAQGHVGTAMLGQHTYAVSWMESDDNGVYAIKLRAATFNGQLGRANTVGRTAIATTVPQMLRVDNELLFAWTDEIHEATKVASVKVRLRGFYND